MDERAATGALPAKEFSLIQEIARKPLQTQRQLSQSTGLSLGMTNILLKRLARKGYIKIKHLDWKRTQYLLTVKGLLEKTRKSYAYALHAISQFRLIRERIRERVRGQYERGVREAFVVAWPETVDVIRECVGELGLSDMRIEYVETFKQLGARSGVVFAATVEPVPAAQPGQSLIPLLEYEDLRFDFPK